MAGRDDDQLIDTAVRLGLAWRFARRARPSVLGDTPPVNGTEDRLEASEIDTLDQIASTGEARMSEIATGLLVDRSTATRAVDRLVDRGLATRRRDPEDARASLVTLTSAGNEAQEESVAWRTASTIRLLEHFDPQDQALIPDLLSRLADAVAAELGLVVDRSVGLREADTGHPLLTAANSIGSAWRFLRRARAAILTEAIGSHVEPPLEFGEVDTMDEVAARGGDASMSDIAAGMQIDRSSATRAVSRLVERGFAVRRRDPTDNRVIRVVLTDAGTSTQAVVRDQRLDFAVRVLAHFSVDDQAAIARLLPAMVDTIADELGLQ